MTITAKFPGRCARCGRAITPGQQIEWSRGQRPYHTACAEAAGTPAAELAGVQGPIAGARGGVRHDARRTNRRPGKCDHCGAYLQVGQGRLEYCVEDSGCMIHHDHGGYHLYCLDTDACQARHTAREAAARERIARRDAENAQRDAVLALFESATVRLADMEADLYCQEHRGDERIELDPGVYGSGRQYLLIGADTVALVHGGWYDDYRTTVRVLPRTAELDAAVRACPPVER